jgi:hypothetical protein
MLWLTGWFRATFYSLMQRNCFTPAMRISAGSLSLLRLQVGARGPRGAKRRGAQRSLSSKPVPSQLLLLFSASCNSPELSCCGGNGGVNNTRGSSQHTGELTTHGGAHNTRGSSQLNGSQGPQTPRTVREQLGLDDKQRLAKTRKKGLEIQAIGLDEARRGSD